MASPPKPPDREGAGPEPAGATYELDRGVFVDDAPLEVDRNEPPPPTPLPKVPPGRAVPDLSVADDPVSGRFTGLLMAGNALEDDPPIAVLGMPSAPAAGAATGTALAPEDVMEIEPGFGDLSWTQTPVPPAPAAVSARHPTPVRRAPVSARHTEPELRRRIDRGWAGSTSWPGMTDEQRRVAIARSTVDVLAAVDRADALADGMMHALVQLPAVIPGRSQFLQDALFAKLPRRSMLAACTLCARWSAEVAAQEGPTGQGWLDAAARLAEHAVVAQIRHLEDGGAELLRALDEDGGELSRRMDADVRDWVRAGRYLRPDAAQTRAATAALDAATGGAEYAAEVGAAERAVQMLSTSRRWELAAPLIELLARHATSPEPFGQRAQLAGAALGRVFAPQVLAPMIMALGEGTVGHDSLVRIVQATGPRAVEAVVAVMHQTPDAVVRRAAGALLRAHAEAARAHALALLARPDLSVPARRTAYEVLGEVGLPEDAQLVARDRDHPSEEIRCSVLWAATAIVRDRAAGLLLRALDDPSAVVQVRAVNLLGQLRSTERNVLDRLARIVEDEAPPEGAELLVTATLRALVHIGNVPLPGRGATVDHLLATIATRPRAAGLRRVLGGRTAELWWQPALRVELCRMLAALGTDRARAGLRKVGETPDDPARDEARRLLAQQH